MFTFFLPLLAAVGGVLGSLSCQRFRASGKAALAVGLVPVAGLHLSVEFC
jgi:hypothetical protein